MAKKKTEKTEIYSCEIGNGSGVYKGVLSRIDLNQFTLDIFRVDAGEKQVESFKKESILVETTYVRPVAGDLKTEEITRRAKAIESFLKKNKINAEEALIVDKKTKKSLIETELKFPCEKVLIEERVLRDVPVIKLENVVQLEEVKTFEMFTRISNKDVRKTITNFINTL